MDQATSWSFYFEGERFFEGTRSFLTAGGIEKPLAERLPDDVSSGPDRIPRPRRAAWRSPLAHHGGSMPEEVDILASRGRGRTVAVLVWRTPTTSTRPTEAETAVELTVDGSDADQQRA